MTIASTGTAVGKQQDHLGGHLVQAPPKLRARLTQAEALEQARKQMKEDQARPKPKRVADEDSSETRDRDRWVGLPKHLSQYIGEQAVISQGVLWTHRIDRHSATTDSQGTKHIPVRLVCLGPVAALDPNYQREKTGLGQRAPEGNKSRDFVLNGNASQPSSHRASEGGNSDTPLGRPKTRLDDVLILKLAAEGQGVKAIARALGREGQKVSHMTIARRLTELRGSGS
jgi:hypothetical protein